MIGYSIAAAIFVLDIIILDVLIACRFFRFESIKKIWTELSAHVLLSLLFAISIALSRNENMLLSYGMQKLATIIPKSLYGIIAFTFFTILVFEAHREYIILNSTVTRSSIYEAVNNVECALAFAAEDGTVIISNRKMNWLVSEMINENVPNYIDLWEYIIGLHGDDRVKRVDSAIEPTFVLPDKSVWEFKMRTIESSGKRVVEILANDLTALYTTMDEIAEENLKLEKIQKELAVTLRNIAEIRQQEELLAYKMRIHDSLGNAILTSSNLIKNDKISLDEKKRAINVWKDTVDNLKKNAYQGENVGEGSMDDIVKTAHSLGTKLIFAGSFPVKNELFAPALREAMYNSIKHAKATVIFADGEKLSDGYKVHISDNGNCNVSEISETGGLATMRRKIERSGGKMCVTINNGLELDLFFPSEYKSLIV